MMFAEHNLKAMPEALAKLRKLASGNPADGIIALLNGMMVRPQRTSVIEKGEVPLLWILGRSDRYFSPEGAMRSIKIPSNAEVQILEESGHLGFIEETELSAEMIRMFARKLNWKPGNHGKE